MKRTTVRSILILGAALLSAVPAGAVTVTCINEGNGVVRVDYDATDETILPAAFALDVTVGGGAIITDVHDYKVGDSTAASRGFGIFPASIQFDARGVVSDWGSPDMRASESAGVQPGLGSSGVTLGMASRYSGPENAPSIKGTLCRIRIDTGGASGVNVKVATNAFGGGVVLENATAARFTGVGCTLGTSSPTPPQPPATITYPATSSTGSYTVSWSASTGATSYQLERSANAGGTWSGIYSGAALSHAETVGNGSYRYRVRATNGAGSSLWRTGAGDCAVTISTPPTPPQPPASISYPSTSSTGKYTVGWAASTGATSYQLERSANAGSTWIGIYSGSALSRAETVADGAYRYRVRATNAAGSSLWRTSSVDCIVSISSSTAAPPQPASITYPSTSNTGQYPVSWAASSGATSYQLDRSVNGGSWSKVYSGPNASYAETVPNGSYRYRVKASNSAGSSKWTTGSNTCIVSISSSTSAPAQPASISYPSTSSTGKYTVSWAASSGASSYQLDRSVSGGSWKKAYSGPGASFAESVGNGTYRYRVKAVNSAGSSKWTTGSDNCVVSISSSTAGAFQQSSAPGGIVSIEAEHFSDKVAVAEHDWRLIAGPAGFADGGAMRAEPPVGATIPSDDRSQGPRLDFEVDFVQTGTHYLWIRGYAADGSEDECYAGFEGRPLVDCDRLSKLPAKNQWVWLSSAKGDSDRPIFEVDEPGIKTVNTWMSEDGFRIDKIVLTTDPEYRPTGTGPAESRRAS